MNATDPTGLDTSARRTKKSGKLIERLIPPRVAGSGFYYQFKGKDHQLNSVEEFGFRGISSGGKGDHAARLDQAIRSDNNINIHVQQTIMGERGPIDIDQEFKGGVTLAGATAKTPMFISPGIRSKLRGMWVESQSFTKPRTSWRTNWSVTLFRAQ